MKDTLILTFSGPKDEYNFNKQLKALKEGSSYATKSDQFDRHNLSDSLEINDYDELEEAIISGQGLYRNLIVLHEDCFEFDRLENIILQDYHRLYERIEVIPERFSRLREADLADPNSTTVQGQATNQATGQTGAASPVAMPKGPDMIIMPINPPTEGAYNAYNQYMAAYGTVKIHIVYQPASLREAMWCSSVNVIAKERFNSNASKEGLIYVYTPSLVGLLEQVTNYTRENKGQNIITIGYPRDLNNIVNAELTALNNALAKNNPPLQVRLQEYSDIQITRDNGAYDIGKEIMNDVVGKKIKYTAEEQQSKQINEWFSNENGRVNPKIGLRGFLLECLRNIKMTEEAYDPRHYAELSDKWQEYVHNRWNQSGLSDTVKAAQENIDQLGGGLFLDAVKAVTDGIKTGLKKERTPTQNEWPLERLCVIHPKFDQFAELFDKYGCFKSLPEDTKPTVAELEGDGKATGEENDAKSKSTGSSSGSSSDSSSGKTDSDSNNSGQEVQEQTGTTRMASSIPKIKTLNNLFLKVFRESQDNLPINGETDTSKTTGTNTNQKLGYLELFKKRGDYPGMIVVEAIKRDNNRSERANPTVVLLMTGTDKKANYTTFNSNIRPIFLTDLQKMFKPQIIKAKDDSNQYYYVTQEVIAWLQKNGYSQALKSANMSGEALRNELQKYIRDWEQKNSAGYNLANVVNNEVIQTTGSGSHSGRPGF